mmetsp:Transcript_10509/g.12801  ORF Transcript_10509/g.12801 Transcript_10509/m.12801 type:complete len:437 (+) Transcript_10509:52-1362(+)
MVSSFGVMVCLCHSAVLSLALKLFVSNYMYCFTCAAFSYLPLPHRCPSTTDPFLKASFDNNNDISNMLSDTVYDTILSGKIATVPNFIPPSLTAALRSDAQNLYQSQHFSADALAAYGTETTAKFDPSKDRTVLKLNQWKRNDIGNYKLRSDVFGNGIMGRLRADLARNLDRPNLTKGTSLTYGVGSTEISYTRFGPGAYLKRHIDEHHEELKGKRGWEKPTRRSITWLLYLNEEDWNPDVNGGELRCFQRKNPTSSPVPVGARPNGDLQIGWLRPTSNDRIERAVFLDANRRAIANNGSDKGSCAMYCILENNTQFYMTNNFDPDPVLFLAGGDFFARQLIAKNPSLAPRFHFLEPPRSAADGLLKKFRGGSLIHTEPNDDEILLDVPPIGGTLVLFDSVILPHEVLPSKGRERWAASGWLHEDQQEAHSYHKYS